MRAERRCVPPRMGEDPRAVPAQRSGGAGMSSARFTVTKHVAVEIQIEVSDVLRAVEDSSLLAECTRRGLLSDGGEVAVTGALIRGARGVLDWTLAQLSIASGVSISTIKRIEYGWTARASRLDAIHAAFRDAGIEFRVVAGQTGILRVPTSARPLQSRVSP